MADRPTLPIPTLADRAAGLLLGGAVGDAFGYAIEFDRLESIRVRYGPAGLTEPVRQAGKLVVSDDTQMTLFTLEGLLRAFANGADPRAEVREAYLDWYGTQRRSARRATGSLAGLPVLNARRAPGTTCLSALAAGAKGAVDRPINDSKGCGGVMRVAPVGLFVDRLEPAAAFALGADLAALTHGHPGGYLSAGLLAAIVRLLADGLDPADATEAALPLLAARRGHEETLVLVRRAVADTSPGPDRIAGLGEGWTGDEAIAIALYAVLAGGGYAETIARAANHDGDSDSTASIAGQIWGAWQGAEGIPANWIDALDVLTPTRALLDDWQAALPG
ncbi:MAG: ADP-ribosylglycohydrolase family protein [Thermomicrobiales bacterium]|nr:ADP-ribosylglycohydrolase family protein [Thermomicrobiales bacterium]